MQGFLDVQAFQQCGGIRFRGVAALIADNTFQFPDPHAIFVGPIVGMSVKLIALLQRVPERSVPHDHGVENAIGIERELVLTQDTDFLGPGYGAFRWFHLTGQDFHERGFTGAIGASDRVAPSGEEGGGYVFKENAGAEAHGNVVYRDQGRRYLLKGFTDRANSGNRDQRVTLLYRVGPHTVRRKIAFL